MKNCSQFLTITCFCVLLSVNLFGQLSGNVSGTQGPGVVTVTGNITIIDGTTLTLLPGTTLSFQPGLTLTVEGQLVAQGTVGSPILFSAAGADWGGVIIDNSATGVNGAMNDNGPTSFSYCEFTNSTNATHGGALSVLNFSNFTLNNCDFSNCNGQKGGAVYLTHVSGLTIGYCDFDNLTSTESGGAICCESNCDNNTIDHCTFDNCSVTGPGNQTGLGARGGALLLAMLQIPTTTLM